MVMASTILLIRIIRTSLGDTCIGSISGYPLENYVQTFHNYLIDSCHQLHVTIMKTFHNYLTISRFSPTHLHGYEKEN
jgi:hypothetical protein